MVKCDIKFDNNTQGIYYTGQSLSGIVELNNDKTRNIRGLSLRVEGFAKVRMIWTFESHNVTGCFSASGPRVKVLGRIGEVYLIKAVKIT